DDNGEITETIVLEKGKKEFVAVPAFTWHTYVMLTDEVIVYEEVDGVYNPDTWKDMATWAPKENTIECVEYLKMLKDNILV
ncbi:MAG: WbuC family cupin fold metalloprotein, partial [Candidatus Thioglobus sp.]